MDLKEKLVKLVYGDSGASRLSKLPGPLPKSMSRADLQFLKIYSYLVTEKSDGVRQMLYCDSTLKSSYFVDRKFDFHVIEHKDGAILPHELFHNDCLFDGEYLPSDNVYLVYDCVCFQGVNVGQCILTKRLGMVREAVSIYRNNATKLPFVFISKTFLPTSKLGIHRANIQKTAPGVYEFQETRDGGNLKLKNSNDGFVFTRIDDSFLCLKDGALLKWKWPDVNSVDFMIQKPFFDFDNNLLLYAGVTDNDNSYRCCAVQKTRVSTEQRALIEKQVNGHNSVVIECVLRDCNWVFCKVRPDKIQPNFITVVTQTVESNVEDVTYEELESACIVSQDQRQVKRPEPPNQDQKQVKRAEPTNEKQQHTVRLKLTCINPEIDESALRDVFGLSVNPRIYKDKKNQMNAILPFDSYQIAQDAIKKFDGHLLGGFEIDLSPDLGKESLKVDFYFSYFSQEQRNKLKLDDTALFSVTEQRLADSMSSIIAGMCRKDIVITDATACVGGNTISFAKTFKHVNAIEIDARRFEYLQNNLDVLDLTKNVTLFQGDSTTIELEHDVVFIDPPWGGVDYAKKDSLDLSLSNIPLPDFCVRLMAKCSWLVLKLPLNINFSSFVYHEALKDFQFVRCMYKKMCLLIMTNSLTLQKFTRLVFAGITVEARGVLEVFIWSHKEEPKKWCALKGKRHQKELLSIQRKGIKRKASN